MAEEKKTSDVPERATQAATRPTAVPLNEFILIPEHYCHRDLEELKNRDLLKPLMDSIIVEGLQTAVEFYRGPDGKPITTKGHRRISAMRQLAAENTPGFTDTMVVESVEVLNASQQDLLCRSVSDNANRKDYTLGNRIRAAKTMHDGGVEANRAALALQYSTKQYLRDLRIAQSSWMLAHVEHDDIGHTPAGELLEAAEKVDRVTDLKTHLDMWIDAKKQEVGKDRKLKSLLSKALSDHWIELLGGQKPLDDEVVQPEAFQAKIDADANLITAEGQIHLLTDPLEDLEKAWHAFASMQKVVREYAKARRAVEGVMGPQDVARMEVEQLKAPLPRQEEAPSDDAKGGV